MVRIAIVHYTVSPAIGGIEDLIDAQCSALVASGHEVRLIAGSGRSRPDVETHLIDRLLPSHPDAVAGRHARAAGNEIEVNRLAVALQEELRSALVGCDACWVHNVFTLAFHPALTSALECLSDTIRDIRWVAWCEDLSVASAYWHEPVRPLAHRPKLRYVTISRSRALELATLLCVPSETITVIPPPIDVLAWLDASQETREIASRVDLMNAYPAIFVPAKLLPHKRIDRAIRATAELMNRGCAARLLVSAVASPHEPEKSTALGGELWTLASELGVRDRVSLLALQLGHAPSRRTIRDLMLLCDVVFLPSAEEGFGLPAREAAALRVPVVCTDIPAHRDAAPSAQLVASSAGAMEVADALLEAARAPANAGRREVFASWDQFKRQIDALVSHVPS